MPVHYTVTPMYISITRGAAASRGLMKTERRPTPLDLAERRPARARIAGLRLRLCFLSALALHPFITLSCLLLFPPFFTPLPDFASLAGSSIS